AVVIGIFGRPGDGDLLGGGARQSLGRGTGGGGRLGAIGDGDAVGSRRGRRFGRLRGGNRLSHDVNALQNRRRILRQVGEVDAVERGSESARAGHFQLPCDVARVGTRDARAGRIGKRFAPFAPGAVGFGGVAGA